MTDFTGLATMYMRMPMSTSSLPIAGDCTVENKRITLKFPFTGIEFELPSALKDIKDVENTFKLDFKIRTSTGSVMAVEIGYISELKCFTGKGTQDDMKEACITFFFFSSKSPMFLLPKM